MLRIDCALLRMWLRDMKGSVRSLCQGIGCAACVKELVREDQREEDRTERRDLGLKVEAMRERHFEAGQEKGVSAWMGT